MPHMFISTPTGDVDIYYNILTPTSTSATSIVPGLPTVVFFHSLYSSQEIFEPQASDPLIRRFNLILIDLRGHGRTKGSLGSPYTPTETAEDVFRVMMELNLPPCHLFGMSIGSAAALELARLHPEHVLSLTLGSPLPPSEPELAQSGREEIWRYFEEGTRDGREKVKVDLVQDSVFGCMQMMFNNLSNHAIDSLRDVCYRHILNNWAFEPEKLREGYAAISTWFASRKVLTTEDLSPIKCPISLIHYGGDLPYPEPVVREMEKMMRAAGLDVTWHSVPEGPHYGSFTDPEPATRILHDTVVRNSKNPGEPLPTDTPRPMMTPFHNELAAFGYYGSDTEGSDDEVDFYTPPTKLSAKEAKELVVSA